MNHTLRNILLPATAALLVVDSLWLTAQDMPVPGPMPAPDEMPVAEEPQATMPAVVPAIAPAIVPATAPVAVPDVPDIAPVEEAEDEVIDETDEPTGFLTLEEEGGGHPALFRCRRRQRNDQHHA